MSIYVPRGLRDEVWKDAGGLCGYCRTHEDLLGIAHEVEHLTPVSRGGETIRDNLWLACRRCNSFKGERQFRLDPMTNEQVALFDPRHEDWPAHFVWEAGGLHIRGRTPTGRATEVALNLNLPIAVRARSLWILSGRFPPRHL